MADVFDRAQELEQHYRDRAIQSALSNSRETEQPDEVDGIRYCLGCGLEIPEERLKSRPESVRCVDCKEIQERRGR